MADWKYFNPFNFKTTVEDADKGNTTAQMVADPFGLYWNKQKPLDDKVQADMDAIQSIWGNFEAPELGDLSLEDYGYLGDISPEMIGYSDIGSAFDSVSADPEMKARQLESLNALDAIIEGGGYSAAEQANLNKIQNEVAQADKGRRDAILQNMAMRGMGGSGSELLAQLQSSQAATDRANQTGLDLSAMAQQRALDAIMQQGNLAGNIRGQGFNEQAQKAQALDAISKFNASNTLAKDQFNAGNKFDAAKFNQGTKQGIANQNTDLQNQMNQWNQVGKKQQAFDNSSVVATGKTDALKTDADYNTRLGDRDAQKQGGMMSGIGSIAGAIFSDERTKKDIEPVDVDQIREFLTSVNPKSFKYKGDNQDKLGMILQDVKDTDLGEKIISHDENGLMKYDSQSLDGIMLGALSELAKKGKI